MTAKVFIDGEAGTTGLQIAQRLSVRRDIELLHLSDAERKDPARRAELLNTADVSILCLPDEAAIEAAEMVKNPAARVIDASTAHRVAEGWTYGFPEHYPSHRAEIAAAHRVSNPGCYALGAVSMLYPLIHTGLLPADHPVTVNAVSGYSGGGKRLIAAFEDDGPDKTDSSFYLYGLGLAHKHIPEIEKHGALERPLLFVPSVGRFPQGMIVSLPLQLWSLPNQPTASDLQEALSEYYANAGPKGVHVAAPANSATLKDHLDPEVLNGADRLTIHVFGNESRRQAVICAVLDNLGKGAAGQAVQNLELMLGLPETPSTAPVGIYS